MLSNCLKSSFFVINLRTNSFEISKNDHIVINYAISNYKYKILEFPLLLNRIE